MAVTPIQRAAAACDYPILPLGQEVGRAPLIVVGDVNRERPDGAGTFTSIVRIRGVLKGRPPGPDVALTGLGHPDGDCAGGPRLPRGGRYVLFLTGDPTQPNAVWGIVDVDGGVYQLALDGVHGPPQQPNGKPELLVEAPADLVRDVGRLAGTDSGRVEDIVSSLGIPEDVQTVGAEPETEHKSLLDHLPNRQTSLAIAAGAVLLASLTFLLWRPAGAHPSR
jgi:hypothetical protein